MANDRIRNVINEDVLMALLAISQDPAKNLSGSANRPIPQAPDNMNPESWRDRNILAERGRHMRANPQVRSQRNPYTPGIFRNPQRSSVDRYPGKGTKFRPPTSPMGRLLPQGMGGDQPSGSYPMFDSMQLISQLVSALLDRNKKSGK